MLWRLINGILVVLVIIPSLLGAHDFSPLGNIPDSGSQGPWGTNQRDPGTPECPNCVSLEDSIDPFLHEDAGTYQLKAVSPLIPIALEVLLDQGFVRSIFRPPASIL
jgi:hypothetical protein